MELVTWGSIMKIKNKGMASTNQLIRKSMKVGGQRGNNMGQELRLILTVNFVTNFQQRKRISQFKRKDYGKMERELNGCLRWTKTKSNQMNQTTEL